MSFTYMHYSTPSSLPSDYAILSRYAATHNPTQQPPDTDLPINNGELLNHTDDEYIPPNSLPIPGRVDMARRSSFPTTYVTPFNPTTGPLPDRSGFRSGPHLLSPNENTPLLSPMVPRIREEVDDDDSNVEPATNLLWDEACILAKYTLPVCGSVHSPFIYQSFDIANALEHPLRYLPERSRTHLLEYSLVIASVVSIGHLSTTALAASTLGSMTASVTGFSIIQGFASTLDTMLPSAWTSSQPQLVGLWSQRMGE